jgi:formamidopyrimidine-DNA glycosylase
MDLIAEEGLESHKLLANVGPEPLGNSFNVAHLEKVFAKRRTPLKAALLDQRLIAGLGNIYVCEALFRAGLHPERPAGDTNTEELTKLTRAIREVLEDAIAAGGSSLRDHRQANGELGYFQHAFKVYGREGEVCPTPDCGHTIQRMVQSGRSTFYCPACQP